MSDGLLFISLLLAVVVVIILAVNLNLEQGPSIAMLHDTTRYTFAIAIPLRSVEVELKDYLLENLESYVSAFPRVFIAFAESHNSNDNTRTIATTWCEAMRSKHSSLNYDFTLVTPPASSTQLQPRTVRIAEARNAGRGALQSMLQARNIDETHVIYVAMDADAVNARVPPPRRILQSLRDPAFAEFAGLSAHQGNAPYYDIWAYQQVKIRGKRETERLIRQKVPRVMRQFKPLPTLSSFGGFALYRWPLIRDAHYSGRNARGTPDCEHLQFHDAIRVAHPTAHIAICHWLVNRGYWRARVPWRYP